MGWVLVGVERGWGYVAVFLWVSDSVVVHVFVGVRVQVCGFGGGAVWEVTDCMGVSVFVIGGVERV